MKVENIKEIGKRMGQQKGKTYNYYKNAGKDSGIIYKLLLKLANKNNKA